MPWRVLDKARRVAREQTGQRHVRRNWELQFQGERNRQQLEPCLFENEKLEQLVPRSVVDAVYAGFRGANPVRWAHPLSMLLTLSVFARREL